MSDTQEHTVTIPLLPCPFCGEAMVEHRDSYFSWYGHKDASNGCLMAEFSVCDDEQAAAWNTRAAPKTEAVAVEGRILGKTYGDGIALHLPVTTLSPLDIVSLLHNTIETVDPGKYRVASVQVGATAQLAIQRIAALRNTPSDHYAFKGPSPYTGPGEFCGHTLTPMEIDGCIVHLESVNQAPE